MSPARTHTVGPAASDYLHDDDDDDICPVCDTECTCNNNRTRVVQQPVSLNQYSVQFDGSSSSTISSASHSLPKPSPHPLKIKLTVPPNFLGNTKSASASNKSKNNQEMTSAFARVGESSRNPTTSATHSRLSSKRRGRPPKFGAVAARQAVKAKAATGRQSTSPPPSYLSRPFISKSTVGRKRAKKSGSVQKRPLKARHAGSRPSLKRKQRARSDDDDESSLSALTDVDYDCDNDDDGESVVFPTFVSASVLSSLESGNSSDSSDSSNSESLSFVTDSDVEEEEEKFIMSEVHEKARLRRELLGDDDHRRDSQGEWVIKSRKKSVGSDDSGMAVDSAATEDEDEDEDEELEEEEEEEETDGRPVGTGYAGLVTAWSDDDESSFDADIFFANLTGSGTDSDSSCSFENHDGVDGDHSDMETNSLNDASELMSRRQELENLQLDVTQGWDGEIVFTNGINDGRGILDIDFEVNASQFMAEDSPEHTQDSDVDMSPCNSIGAADGEGYEEDDNAADGDTTDEDLVGEDDLPNEQAMKLFSLPFSVSAIDPLSTVSPIASPTYRRVPPGRRGLGSPKPEDILAGKFSWDSEDHDYDEVEVSKERRGSQGSGIRGPRTGLFVPVQETRKAIIDGTNQVPSPHPRYDRHRSRSTTARINSVEQRLRRRLLNGSGSAPTFSTASELLSPLQLLSSDNDFGSPSPSMPMSALPEERGSQSINIDDVLEASYLGADSSEASDNSITKRTRSNAAEDDNLSSARHMQSLNRWDLISVGAFKQTQENGGWSSDNLPHTPHSSMDYNSIMKPSPLSSIMWPKEKEKVRKGRKGKEPIPISPVILAVRDGDGSPSGSGNRQQNESLNKHMQYRKESKRERKLKKKNWGPVHHQHAHHNHYHQHQHHPNTKMRGSVANQRSSLSSVPPFSL